MAEEKESYFNLETEEQSGLLNNAAAILGLNTAILEKDIWLCLVLKELFGLPQALPMTFKGGTSLSKVYRAIERFSEDIDITIDWTKLHPHPPDLRTLSKSKIKDLSGEIKELLARHIADVLKPALQSALKAVSKDVRVEFEVKDGDGALRDKLRVFYPAAMEKSGYIPQSVLIEFGARNEIEPGDVHTIVPDVAELFPEISFPEAHVHVLSPLRTFWEKATLLHDECHRPVEKVRVSVHRMARHWYDLARLALHDIGEKSIDDLELLGRVIDIKTWFYRYGSSRYELCNTGGMKLIPSAEALAALRQDYGEMVDAQMFYGEQLEFDEIIERLTDLQERINSRCSQVTIQPQGKE